MKNFFKEYWGTIIGSFCIIVTLIAICTFVISYFSSSSHVHVHFFDTNECYDVKSTWAQEGIVFITFNDGSSMKIGATNVVVFVDHVCDYCGK